MSFTLTIDTANAAFDSPGDPSIRGDIAASEICRILEEDVMHGLIGGQRSGTVRDVNGNKVGSWSLDLDEIDEPGEADEHPDCAEGLHDRIGSGPCERCGQ